MNADIPESMEIQNMRYMLAGVVLGTTVHARAIVVSKNGGYELCDDIHVTPITKCTTNQARMIFYTR